MKRTNIVLDEKLVEEAKQLTGIPTKKALVDHALKELVRKKRCMKMVRHFGKIPWVGDLDQMRRMD